MSDEKLHNAVIQKIHGVFHRLVLFSFVRQMEALFQAQSLNSHFLITSIFLETDYVSTYFTVIHFFRNIFDPLFFWILIMFSYVIVLHKQIFSPIF